MMARVFSSAMLVLALWAQGRPASAQRPGVQPVFRAQMALAHPEVRQGRVCCRLNRLTRWGNSMSRKPGVTETLRFEQTERGVSMHYKLTGAESRLTIDAWEHELTIVSEQLDGGDAKEVVRFVQRPGEPLSLEFDASGAAKRVTGDSIWHLWLAERELCQRELAPLLNLLGITVPWGQFAQALETKLFFLADAGQAHDAAMWRVWLAQLKDDRYTVREAADRQLRAAGTALAPFVRRLDMSQLDAEQRYRLRRIMAEYQAAEAADTIESTAEWLADDPLAWLILFDRADVKQRATAARQLERLLGFPIEFDAGADEDVRRRQVDALHLRVSRAFDHH